MNQYSIFTHGNALVAETPAVLQEYRTVGWGTWIAFKEPETVPSSEAGFDPSFLPEVAGFIFH